MLGANKDTTPGRWDFGMRSLVRFIFTQLAYESACLLVRNMYFWLMPESQGVKKALSKVA